MDSFVIFTGISEAIEDLTNEQKGILFQAILDYEKNEEMPEIEDAIVKTSFKFIKQDLDINNKKWKKAKEARSNAGKKSAESRLLNKAEQNPTNVNKDEQSQLYMCNTYTYTSTDTLTDTEDDKDTELQGYFNDPDLNKSFNDYVDMRIKQNKPVDFQRTQRNLYDMAKGDIKTMIAILEQSITQGWTGLYELKEKKDKPPDKKNKFHNFSEREYDWDELEKEVLNSKPPAKSRDG